MTWFDSAKKLLAKWKAQQKIQIQSVYFTPRAQQVFALARKEADRFNYDFVDTEHILIGLIKLGQGVGVKALQKVGVNLEAVRREVEKQIVQKPDRQIIGNTPCTPRVKKVLALAAEEAKNLNHTYVGTEHVLLGLLREGGGMAGKVLQNLNVNTEQMRQEILQELVPQSLSENGESEK